MAPPNPSIRPIVRKYMEQGKSLETLAKDSSLKKLFETAYDFCAAKFGRVTAREVGLAAVMVELTLLAGVGDIVNWIPRAEAGPDGKLAKVPKPKFVAALQGIVEGNIQLGMLRMVRKLQDEFRMVSDTDRQVWDGLVAEWPGEDDGHDTLLAKPARRSEHFYDLNTKIRLR